MVYANDHPVESFFNSIQVALSPLESGFRKAAKDLETCWAGPKDKPKSLGLVNSGDSDGKIQISALKRKSNGLNGHSMVNTEEKKKGGLSIKVPIKNLLGLFSPNVVNVNISSKVEVPKKGLKERDFGNEEESCINCLRFAVTWDLLVNSFVQVFPSPFKMGKKKSCKTGDEKKRNSCLCIHAMKSSTIPWEVNNAELKDDQSAVLSNSYIVKHRDGNGVSLECLIGFIFDQLVQNLQKLDQGKEMEQKSSDSSPLHPPPTSQFDHLGVLMSIWEGRKADVNGFLGNLKFARVGGIPSSVVGVSSSVGEESDNGVGTGNTEETGDVSQQKGPGGLLSIPLSNVERLKSTLSTVSFTELIELVPHLGRPSNSKDYPDKKKLISVQDFFRYTESEGKRFFEEMDRDGDGQVNLEDLEIAMKKRNLPRRYAREFMCRARSHLFSKSFGWKQFLSLMEQREPTILRAYTSLCLSKSGTLQKSELLASLKNAGLPANEDNAVAMMRFLNADTEESISYGHFRDFMLLLPSDRLQDDPRNIWFEAATVVAVAPPVDIPTGSVLKSALAGGLSCALSTSLLHPVDTIKTRVQASTLTFPEIIAKLPQIGTRGLYRGSIPAILGQFSSHGLRTGIFEASKLVLINVAPTLPDIQVQSISSFCSTVLGTAVRIPCEVLKQRLQAGIFDNVGEAIVGTWQQDGLKGFFRGTGATLCREVPFYVAGMGLYAESKKAAQKLLGRELEPWEVISVGALSGGLAAVVTTPFDVMKTRMMTAARGRTLSMTMVAFSILRHEGPLGLFKGALPRFFWIAPLGAMNFAGYELAKKAMVKNEEAVGDQPSQKKLASSG
ncbi:Mitochondrial substrate carrier family protein isoform 1 [Tripterygium wilfordii]|uniref:Mitochondrial substrate carrier family protein isoform 1 n=1 Tax=Tripterygium wilfordii TaxID=458696 RepID=A0A7J7C5R8_TRIWF|nr:calcium-dependent mitochondrial ATP-magnesium/phosphate carrier protein 1 [Tripterygium wilfordii]KAF5729520.1 Mitochondrial substrate carrier family protein isoform 1 [Tripterygium wilfordii]